MKILLDADKALGGGAVAAAGEGQLEAKKKKKKRKSFWISLMVQWLGIHLPRQGTWVPSLV